MKSNSCFKVEMKIFIAILFFYSSIVPLSAEESLNNNLFLGDWINTSINELDKFAYEVKRSPESDIIYKFEMEPIGEKYSVIKQPVSLFVDENKVISTLTLTDRIGFEKFEDYMMRYRQIFEYFIEENPNNIKTYVWVFGRQITREIGVSPSVLSSPFTIKSYIYFNEYFVKVEIVCGRSPFGNSDMLEVFPVIGVEINRND